MMVGNAPFHLTYSTSLHPSERWSEARAMLDRYVLPVRRRVSPGRRFGLGLRLSGRAAMDLEDPNTFAELRDWLARHDVYVFTVDGSAYGRFQGQPMKTAVYRPDWLDEERVRYTQRLAHILAALVPAGSHGTINTVPGAFRARVRSRIDDAAIADRLLRTVAMLVRLRDKTDRIVAVALEPEPACRLATIGETIEFFDRHLHGRAATARVAALTGLDTSESADAIRRHLGVCLDACHVAVEFEDPSTALRALDFAGLPVLKVQLGAAIRVRNLFDRHVRDALQPLADDVHLHQVTARCPGRLRRYVDLPLALAAPALDADEWRIHAHVPIAHDPTGPLGSTRNELSALLTSLRRTTMVRHFEVETHTWTTQQIHRAGTVVDGIVRDLEWATAHLTDVAKSA